MLQFGRQILYTDVQEVTRENIADILRDIMPYHEQNATDINTLLEFEAGKQKRIRKKTYRPEIDNWCVDNVANEASSFWIAYGWGNTMTFSMRKQNNDSNKHIADGIFELNKFYDIQGYNAKQQELARYVVIGGVGYTYVDINTDYEIGDSPFTIDILDPRCTFIVRSSYYVDKRPMLAGTYRCDKNGNKTFTIFTKDSRYELNSSYEHTFRSGEVNPLGIIPINEWFKSYDRMGVFERQISEMNNLNLLISNFSNDVDQNTQCVWLTTDIEFPKVMVTKEDGTQVEEVVKPKNGDWMQAFSTQDGKTPNAKPLVVDYDYTGMLNNIINRRALILQKCNVPSRNDNSGGSTGVAMSDATGWSQAETEATRQDQIKTACKINEVKIVLRAIAKCSHFDINNPVRQLHYSDVDVNIPRQKTYELTVKTNAICALIAKGFSLEDTLAIAPLFEDNNQVIVRSGEGVRKFQEANVFKEEQTEAEEKRPFADLSDQQNNSPNIGGMSKTE